MVYLCDQKVKRTSGERWGVRRTVRNKKHRFASHYIKPLVLGTFSSNPRPVTIHCIRLEQTTNGHRTTHVNKLPLFALIALKTATVLHSNLQLQNNGHQSCRHSRKDRHITRNYKSEQALAKHSKTRILANLQRQVEVLQRRKFLRSEGKWSRKDYGKHTEDSNARR